MRIGTPARRTGDLAEPRDEPERGGPNGNVQWANDLQFSTSSTSGPLTWPFDLQQTTDGGYVVAGYAFAPRRATTRSS